MTGPDLTWGLDFDIQDHPGPDFIAALRAKFPTEREVDKILTRKLSHRAGPPYQRPSLDDMAGYLDTFLTHELGGAGFRISELRWFTGGVSKIQIGFTLDWQPPGKERRRDRLVLRMDPSEGSNATSRAREFELLGLMNGVIPVPETFFLDAAGTWFPEPAMIYAFAPGVTKPRLTQTGKISGLGTDFGPEYRRLLAPQYIEHLARIHTTDVSGRSFDTLDVPETGTTQAAQWALNHALRTWEEDRGEDSPLMEVAASWLLRNLPALDVLSVVHGDYRSGNFLFDPDTGQINAWLDWERGHLGDRHRDLAWITLPTMGHYDRGGRYYVCGLVPLDEFFERYSAVSGLPVDAERLRYYQVLCCFVIIVSTMASNYRIAGDAKLVCDEADLRLQAALRTAVDVIGDTDAQTGDLRAASKVLWAAVRGTIRESRRAPDEVRRRIEASVVRLIDPLVTMESAWYLPFGFEPDPASVPGLGELFGRE